MALLINLYEDLGIYDSTTAKWTKCTNVARFTVRPYCIGLRVFPVGKITSEEISPPSLSPQCGVHSKDGTAIFNSQSLDSYKKDYAEFSLFVSLDISI